MKFTTGDFVAIGAVVLSIVGIAVVASYNKGYQEEKKAKEDDAHFQYVDQAWEELNAKIEGDVDALRDKERLAQELYGVLENYITGAKFHNEEFREKVRNQNARKLAVVYC